MTKILFELSKKPNLREKAEWILPHYLNMLANINFIRSDEISEYKIEDLWHIKDMVNLELRANNN